MASFDIVSRTRPLLEYLKQQQDNHRFIKSVELGATFLLVSFFLFFAIKPTIFTVSTLIGETTSKGEMVTKMRNKINDVIQAQDNFAKVESRYQIIEDALPDNPRYSNAAIQTQSAASKLNIGINRISFNINADETGEANLSDFSIPINGRSPFFIAVGLLDRLANNRRLMQFKSISFNNDKSVNDGQINFSFNTDFFYWR